MKNLARLFLALIWLMIGSAGFAQASKPASENPTIAQVLDRSVSNVENEFVPAAAAMPEDKYSFAPSHGEFKGVRTFAQQIKHVAASNYMIAAAILGEKPPVELGGENGPDSMTAKADIVEFAKDSFAYAHKAVATINEKNLVAPIKNPFGEGTATRLGMATSITWHSFDHYGQMVEYLRMNGMIPPASRR
ncbi:MAG: DinB family protein [Acidobacteria bacterium]|nr:MAG: DinB family protein [Acidobacteriota bacterium]